VLGRKLFPLLVREKFSVVLLARKNLVSSPCEGEVSCCFLGERKSCFCFALRARERLGYFPDYERLVLRIRERLVLLSGLGRLR
jgi:hypothetical protein